MYIDTFRFFHSNSRNNVLSTNTVVWQLKPLPRNPREYLHILCISRN